MTKEALKLALEALESCGSGHITDGGQQWFDGKLVDKAYEAIEKALSSPNGEAQPEQEPVAKNENGSITWLVDNWPQNCLLYTTSPQPKETEQVSPMSEPNRAIAYAASGKLHELGYRYLDGKWMQPKEPEQEPVENPFEDKSVISALSWAAGLIEKAYRECGGHNGADSWLMNYADKQGERIRQADHREWEKVNGRWQVKETTPPQRTWVGLTDEEIDFIDAEITKAGYCQMKFTRAIEAKCKENNT